MAVVLAATCLAPVARAQSVDEDTVKAVFLVRFASFVTWPADRVPGVATPLTLCFVGSPTLVEKVRATTAADRLHNLRLVTFDRADPSEKCHILFAGIGAEQGVIDALRAVRDQPVLTVTDERNGESRGVIHFAIIDRRVRFHIDLEAAQEKRLQLNSRLLSVAATVRKPGGLP